MNKQPKVYIIILNWNGLKDTLGCLESVFRLDYPNFEVIVVDNGSTDNSVEVIERTCPRITLLRNKDNLGFTGGNNIAMKYAMEHGADYVWLLNNDTIADRDTLRKVVDCAENHSEVGLVSPVIYYYSEPDNIQFCGSYVDLGKQTIVCPVDRNLHINENFQIGINVCLWGTALLIKRKVIDKTGYLHEKFFAYYEDTEYSIRAAKAGFLKMVDLQAKIYHKTTPWKQGMVNRNSQFFYFMLRNRYFLWQEYLSNIGKVLYFKNHLATAITSAANCYYNGATDCADACLDGVWSAFQGIDGRWDREVRMPFILRKILMWHPYLWANFLEGNFSHIISETLKRLRLRLINGSSLKA